MKTRFFFAILIIVALFSSFFIPDMFKSSIPSGNVVFLEKIEYYDKVLANGCVEYGEETNVTLEYPVVAEKIHFSVGDYVKKGDVVVSVDRKSTIAAFKDFFISMGINPQQTTIKDAYELIKQMPTQFLDMIPEQVKQIIETAKTSFSGNVTLAKAISENNITTEVVAKNDGYIKEMNAKYTSLSDFNKPIFVTVSDDKLKVKVSVDEKNITKISVGQSAIIKCAGIAKQYEGKVAKISESARQITSLQNNQTVVDVFISFRDIDALVKAGFNVKSEIYLSEKKEALVLPYEAVYQDGDNNEFVYVLNGNIATKKIIKTGDEFENGVAILDGISTNDAFLVSKSKMPESENVNVVISGVEIK